ncbi:MAG: CAP domain-containing protein [Selenomonadaceae bacterium]|nr:CAP domain-containing protein [Selenomonadaceae bacterium]
MKKLFMSVMTVLILLTYANICAAENYVEEVLYLVNVERAKVGVAPLRLAEDLNYAADIRAREIVEYFSHDRPDGSDCFTVIERKGRTHGENIAAGQDTPEDVVDSWMNSEGHRENILDPRFKEIGIGCVYSEDSRYDYYWVQLFRG